MKFQWIKALAVLALWGWAALGLGAPKPNLLFILSDDHSLQTIGAYRTWLSEFCRQHGVTPNLDQLAGSGGIFVNSFCGNSLCSPSRASILTGLHSHANGVMVLDKAVREGVWTFPGSVRGAGYQTAVIGKWHLAKTPANTDYWRLLPGQGAYWNPQFIGPEGTNLQAGYATDLISQMSLDWLKQRDKTRPFLLMVQHKAPHRPWVPPPRYYQWLAGVSIPEPPTLFDDYAGRTSSARNQKMEIGRDMTLASDLKVLAAGKTPGGVPPAVVPAWEAAFGPRNEAFRAANLQGAELTRWKYQEYMKDYLRCVKAVDDSVGQLLDYLKAEGLEQNTVVIYASDQGFYNGEHGWFDKRWIYEESIHMPLIVRWPGVVAPGTRFTQMVQNIDYAPTFVELAGGKPPEGLHGRSLAPILRGQTPADWRKSVYYHYYDPGHGVQKHYGLRTERYTLAYFYPVNEWELYDLERDPRQLHSVYEDPAYAKTLAGLKAELERLRREFKDDSDRAAPAKGAEAGGGEAGDSGARPNIVFILTDDLGYGDLGCYGATKARTPNLDRLASQGLRFTDAHCTASVCTPTRYALMTGQYAWRTTNGGAGILSGVAPLSIKPGTVTVPALLKRAGYVTGLVGKWHLGLGEGLTDYNREIKPGPLEVGFDSAFFIPATGDRVPCVFVENHRVFGQDPADPIQVSYRGKIGDEPTGRDPGVKLKIQPGPGHFDTVVNGIPRIGFMSGGQKARWVDEDIADTLAARAVGFLEANAGKRFFLYLATHDIHEPMVPHPRFKGASDCGSRGDVIQQMDWTVGEVLGALDRLGLSANTLVIFTSDNGGAIKNTYDDGTNPLHERQPPNGALRGQKGTLYEGGHRVPFLARWPGHVAAGGTNNQMIGLVDMLASFAALTGQALPPGAGPDSVNVLPALLGQPTDKPVRDHLVFQNNGANSPLGIRQGTWKLIEKPGARRRGAGAADAPAPPELYNLATDPGETNNLAASHPEKVRELSGVLEAVRKGRARE